MRLLLSLPGLDARVVLTIDDTLARHTGKHIAAGAMHRDPLLSCGGRPVVVPLPEWNKVFSLPVLMRLRGYLDQRRSGATAGRGRVRVATATGTDTETVADTVTTNGDGHG